MVNVKNMPQKCIDILTRNNWSITRNVNVNMKIVQLEREGWVVFPEALQLIESLDGLPEFRYPLIHSNISRFKFDCLAGDFDHKNIIFWESEKKIKLFPIGSLGELYLLTDSEGILYGTDSYDIIFRFGHTMASSFEKLMFFGGEFIDMSPL